MQKLVFALFLLIGSLSSALTWQSVFIAGDNSINNFDNGREDLSALFSKLGKLEQTHFSSSQSYISQANKVWPATVPNLSNFFLNSPAVKQDEGCFIHMTSHGAKNKGFYLALSGILNPRDFAMLVNKRCGKAPTVILVSACYSGQFITDDLKGPNRIIMTAAIADRPSFGCSADTRYTYWDACLLDVVPQSKTWTEVYDRVRTCISRKESQLGAPSSMPQAFFGSNTSSWGLFR